MRDIFLKNVKIGAFIFFFFKFTKFGWCIFKNLISQGTRKNRRINYESCLAPSCSQYLMNLVNVKKSHV